MRRRSRGRAVAPAAGVAWAAALVFALAATTTCLCAADANQASPRPSEREGQQVVEAFMRTQLEQVFRAAGRSTPRMQLTSFKKTNGQSRVEDGVQVYRMQFEIVTLYPDGLLPDCFEAERVDDVMRKATLIGDCVRAVNLDHISPYRVGEGEAFEGTVQFEMTENGWRGAVRLATLRSLGRRPPTEAPHAVQPPAEPTHTTSPAIAPSQPLPLTIRQAVIATAVGEDGRPLGVGETFNAEDKRLVCYVSFSEERAGQRLEIVWINPYGEQDGRTSEVLETPPRGQERGERFVASHKVPRGFFHTGEWRANVYVDGVLVKAIPFRVR